MLLFLVICLSTIFIVITLVLYSPRFVLIGCCVNELTLCHGNATIMGYPPVMDDHFILQNTHHVLECDEWTLIEVIQQCSIVSSQIYNITGKPAHLLYGLRLFIVVLQGLHFLPT